MIDTGTYGVVTAASVFAFQQKYNIAPLTRWIYRGFYFGPATRAVMNSIYNK
jgi:peptidoglycan hydrolase-like protein with peptidoglycan-binding domain